MNHYDTDIDLLRFTTSGSVDDGKSTLIGRLLYDCKSIFEDQLHAIEQTSQQRGNDYVDLALLTDGLSAEREQGITIDVAYRYFATPNRKFIIADTPGHIQYTRNMVTGASTANLALILIDARHGLVEQTRRHALIASILGIKHLIVCINKMDLVDYEEEVFHQIIKSFKAFSSKLDVPDVQYVPISALHGDNVVSQSTNMGWYKGTTLLYLLENVQITSDYNHIDCRFPVQTVIRPQTDDYHDYRAYAGQIAGGVFKPGDEIITVPSGLRSTIKAIYQAETEVDEAFQPMSVSMTLEDDVDISRGDMIIKEQNQPHIAQDFDAMICWLHQKPLASRTKYIIKHTSQQAQCMVSEVLYKMDINSLHRAEGDLNIGINDVGRIRLKSSKPLFFDHYKKNRATGSFILIDAFTHDTVAAGMIL